jgi:phospholipid/cholesterol/gamma-HCH transport system substrate-binding protein
MTARLRLRRVVAATLLVALAAVALPACSLPFVGGGGGTYRLSAYFDRAVSVFKSSDVRILGLQAGTVRKITVVGNRVRVDMAISNDIPVPADVSAQIVPQSLIGERYIQLAPAYKDGMAKAKAGHVITEAHTITPVEPDEALAAVKKFLDSLDPHGLGQLVSNLDEDLKGNGAALNDTLGSLSKVVSTFAAKDDQLGHIIDSFDRLTATLATRDQQLGQVLDAFAQVSQVLADERQSISGLVGGLAQVSRDGLELVGQHSADLRADITTLTKAAATIDANLGSVSKLLDAGALIPAGLANAYDPQLRAVNLRNNFSPLVNDALQALLGELGVPSLCLPVLATCGVAGASAAAPTPAHVTLGPSPIASLLDLLSATGAPPPNPGRGLLESLGGRIHDGATTLLGVGG